jgi:hypothetical protein
MRLSISVSAAAIVDLLHRYRLPISDEVATQERVAQICAEHRITAHREYSLEPELGRIDFYLPVLRIGLELKVKGSPTDVARQLQRYALSPEIDELILLTGRARLLSVPREANGKPIIVVSPWVGAL